jgi:hypothetical protein
LIIHHSALILAIITAINFIYQKHVGLSTGDLSAAFTLIAIDIFLLPITARAAANLHYIAHTSIEF